MLLSKFGIMHYLYFTFFETIVKRLKEGLLIKNGPIDFVQIFSHDSP
jgi:hypothetical protein